MRAIAVMRLKRQYLKTLKHQSLKKHQKPKKLLSQMMSQVMMTRLMMMSQTMMNNERAKARFFVANLTEMG